MTAIVIVRTHASQADPVTVADIGTIIPGSGGSVQFSARAELRRLAKSDDLIALATDDEYGVGESTLIVNDGVDDVVQAEIETFLANIVVSSGPSPRAVLQSDAAGCAYASDVARVASGVVERTDGYISKITKDGGREVEITRNGDGYVTGCRTGKRLGRSPATANNE